MNHPSYPLRERESAEITACIETFGSLLDIAAIMTRYHNYREAEFPGWRKMYDEQMKLYLASQSHPVKPTTE